MKDALREVRGIIKEDTTSSYPPKEINKKKHAAYKDPKRGEHEIIKKETNDPTIDDIAKGLKLDKKLVKKIMGEVFDYDEKVLDENVSQQIKTLKTIMAPMRGAKISIDGAKKLMDIMDKFDKKEDLIDLFKADIPFVSQSAAARLISKFRMSGAEINKLREEVELKERMGPIKPRHYDVEVTIKNRRDAEAVDEYISNNMSFGIEDYDNDGIMTASGYTAGTVYFHGDDAGHIGVELQRKFGSKIKVVGEEVELGEMHTYTVVHVKHDKEVVKANSSYEAAKKYAQMKGLKSTAGVDAHLMEETINEFTKKDFDKNEDENKHTENGVAIVNKFGTSAEKMQMAGIASRHKMNNSISIQDQQARDKMINKYYNKLESVNLDEKKSFTPQQIRQAYGIANDKRYKGGNLTGAVAAIEKIADGLSLHPDVLKVLQRTHEEVELSLAVESLFMSEGLPNSATRNALIKLAKQGGMDKRDYEKAEIMYRRGEVKDLRKMIYDLDTEPREEIMSVISKNDKAFFKKMYPKARAGDFMSSISYQHRNEDFKHQGAKELFEKIEGLKNKAEKSGMPYSILKKVYDRGMAAWKGGHRPGASQQQWAFARVNSFITKSSGTWGGADKDLAAKVRSSKK